MVWIEMFSEHITKSFSIKRKTKTDGKYYHNKVLKFESKKANTFTPLGIFDFH